LFSRKKRTDERFGDLTFPYLKFLYNVALRYTGNRYDAEDLVQETLFSAYKNIHQLRDEKKCKAWLFAILRNTYIQESRQRGRMESLEYVKEVDYLGYLEEMADRSDVEKIIDKKIDSSRIQQALKKLPEKYKTPVILHYMEGMLYREISATMEIPIGTVMSRLARGRVLLKKEIMRLLTSKTNVVELRKAAARE